MLANPKPNTTLKALFAAVACAVAASANADTLALDEVVVTAQKREESIQDTPISLAAFSTADLENKGINGLVDLRSTVPNLQLTPHPNSSATARVFMRGVGNNDDQITMDPSVAVYLDGVYVARSQGLAMDVADIERVEVLRGPQGSLYGRNATGGAINFITKAPELGRFGFQEALTLGNDNLLRSRTQANLPLTDTLALQLSYLTVKKDGFVKNEGTGVSRFGDQDRQAYRAALNWQPSDNVDVRYSFDHSQIDDTPAFIAAVPNFPEQGKRPSHGSVYVKNLRANDVAADGHNLTISWDINDSLSFKSITGYRKLDNDINENYNAGILAAIGYAPYFTTATTSSQHQFSQEFQLVGDALDSRLEYVAGLYYFDEKGDSFDNTVQPGLVQNRQVKIKNEAYAIFGQAKYTPAILDDRLHITVGARRSLDKRYATMRDSTRAAQGKGDKDFNNFSPSLIIAYDITSDVNAYAKAVKGYKTGGFNVRATSIERFNDGFSEENLTSYELGIKSQWWDNRVRLNAAVFQADYKDIQVNVQTGSSPRETDVFNAGKARINGFEMDANARLTEGLTVGVNYAYLDASYRKINDPRTGQNIANRFYFVEAPHNSYSANVQYEFPATPVGVVTAMADYTWQAEKFSSSGDKGLITNDYGLLNARLQLSQIPIGTGDLRVALWGRNLEDKQYYASMFNGGRTSAIFGDPRSYGVDFVYQY